MRFKNSNRVLLFKSVNIFLIMFLLCIHFVQFGCQKEKGTTKIGVILPLTGDYASYGKMSQKGMIIAYEEWNDNSNIKLDVVFEDNQSEINGALDALNKLINIDSVPVIIGGLSSSIASALAPRCEENKVILMCAFASSAKITNAGDYVFRIMPSDDLQARLTSKWFKELGISKVGIIYEHNDWSAALKDAFKIDFDDSGDKIVFEEAVKETQKDFKDVLSKLKNYIADIDAIYQITYPKEGGILLRQLRELGIDKPVFGADPWANKEIIGIAGPATEGTRFLAPLASRGTEYQDFAQRFEEKFEEKPDLTASAGYDSMRVILYAIQTIIENEQDISGKNMKAILYRTRDFKGATGSTTFDENGDVIGKEFSKYVIKNQELVIEGELK